MISPRTKILLTSLNRQQRRLSASNLDDARVYFEKICRSNQKPNIRNVYEKQINSHGQPITLRVYEGNVAKPTIIYFHGGGFVVGSIDSHDTVARHLCKTTGSTVVSVNYRLAPEYPYPAASQDGLATVKWLHDSELNPNFILSGDSAGGQIAVMVALGLTERQRHYLQSLILMYPALDPALKSPSMQKFAQGFFVSKENMQYFWNAYQGQSHIGWPLKQNQLKKLPRTLILTAEYDILRDEALEFFEHLRKAGVEAEYHSYKGAVHGLMQMPSFVNKRSRALNDIFRFVKSSKLSN
ncbi:MAG TPA: alpha/beta hydrolase [Verrucomicrobiae bacterium]|nr:alpha/beta hydrolase [Verrucomicrobiae bacterium]